MGDSLNSLVAGIFNSFPSTTFAQNNGVIQLTGVATRQVGYWVTAALCLLGLIPEFGRRDLCLCVKCHFAGRSRGWRARGGTLKRRRMGV